jgi:putative SOS response-associated peptidase YedK
LSSTKPTRTLAVVYPCRSASHTRQPLRGDSAALLRTAPDGLLRVWPVDRRVGSPRNNGPELLEAIAA